MIQFFVPGEPRGKQRPRVTHRGTYTPKETTDAEQAIGWECKCVMNGAKPLEGPIELEIIAVFPVPESWSKKRRQDAYWKTTKPDGDNLAKLVGDSLNGVAWIDDAQVARQTIIKRYASGGGFHVGLHVTIRELT